MSTGTLVAALAAIEDHRTKKGRRFPLPAIIMIALCAMLSGANDLMAIYRWGRRLSPKALQALGFYHQKIHVLSEMNKTIACSVAKAERELGYNPTVALEEGMRRSLRWGQENGQTL